MRMTRRSLWAVGMVAAMAATGCSSLSAGGASAAHVRDQMREYRFPRACEALWVDALRVLADEGGSLYGSDRDLVGQDKQGGVAAFLSRGHATTRDDSGTFESETDGDGQGLRYRVRGKPASKDGCFVQYFTLQEDRTNFSEKLHRDYDLELKLLVRIDPPAAARIADAADKAAR